MQGVGFRPFVFRLAHSLGLDGTVANDASGVHIHVAGSSRQIEEFTRQLGSAAPPAARISKLTAQPLPPCQLGPGFHILASRNGSAVTAAISPDLATCADCRAEILAMDNRRYRYPFTNCTNCGPRFTITARIPYDRPNTSMRAFPMCADCRAEYENPRDRRFHAQPNACPVCGPHLSWHNASGQKISGDPLVNAVQALGAGAVVAIKGLGGFHLAVDACNPAAVRTLRERKKRPAKPLAIMVADLDVARSLCHVSGLEASILISPQHPIVLLAGRDNNELSPELAPGLGIIGLMLAYTPLHHLLFAEQDSPKALVMTSGNASGSPICTQNDDALKRLAHLADFFLLHNRDILTRVDDSVLRVMAGTPRLIRRARGYAPAPLALAQPCEDTLACGAAMKNTFCLVRNNEACLSQHIGELDNTETFDFYLESINHLKKVLQCHPGRLVCDLHPDYLSSRYARSLPQKAIRVQHHHAHALAVMAEHGLDEPVLALVLDGTGYGDDGTVFGGELYEVSRRGYQRLASLASLPLPGGDQAVLEPWRLGLALAWQSGADQEREGLQLPASLEAVSAAQRQLIITLLQKKLNCPLSSSAGRLFDAVSALLGLCLFSQYEGQAAMLLEQQASLARPLENGVGYPVLLEKSEGRERIATRPMTLAVLQDIAAGRSVPEIAWAFHHWLAASCMAVVEQCWRKRNLNKIVLAGGCMQNKILLEMLTTGLGQQGMQVYCGQDIPMNDGGIALGQAYFAGDEPCV